MSELFGVYETVREAGQFWKQQKQQTVDRLL